MEMNNSLRRSILGIPGNESGLVDDAVTSAADEVFLDLEDSLAPAEKEAARQTLIDIVDEQDWTETGLSYRINGVDTRWWDEDIRDVVAAVGRYIDTLIVPKVRSPADIHTVENLVTSVETRSSLDPGSITLCAQIETATGMNAVKEIANASDRLGAIFFGPADYAASIGTSHGPSEYPGHYWHYPLSRIAHAAAGAGLLAIGGPYTDAEDPQGFYQACKFERALGYDGKVVIHPEQIETANNVFSPTLEESQRAQQIVRRYEAADSNATAAIDGKVIDREMYRMAKQILSKATAADML